MVPWNAARTKVQIKLSIQRLRTLQEKKLALAKKSRREIADLLQKGRAETARLRVEGLIQDDIYVELLEVLELYSETLQARFGLLEASTGEEPEPSIADAVNSIVYAAQRTELKELQILREMLMFKFGRNFSLSLQASNPPPPQVPTRVTSKLRTFVPTKELVDAYLGEIAKGYGVSWLPEPSFSDTKVEEDGGDDEGDENVKGDKAGADGDHVIEEGKGGGETGIGAKETSTSGNKKESAKMEKKPSPSIPNISTEKPSIPPPKKLSDEEELALRFERLKKL